jgi:ABC-2 type transport system ATP-binding protein
MQFARLNARLQGVPDPDEAAARAIATVDLTDAADRPIGTYSKGMRQRAKLAGALVHEPTVLLLDEPFNGMDPRQRLHMMALLRSMAAAGRTILFSSHILEEVERLADSVLSSTAARCTGRFPLDPA